VAARLAEAGVAANDLERIHTPIGIELQAETLEEIAVSILSEIIQVNRAAATAPEPA
jgi:xanthine dehydrogenase accessory factor